jgi:hypothetical protein
MAPPERLVDMAAFAASSLHQRNKGKRRPLALAGTVAWLRGGVALFVEL